MVSLLPLLSTDFLGLLGRHIAVSNLDNHVVSPEGCSAGEGGLQGHVLIELCRQAQLT